MRNGLYWPAGVNNLENKLKVCAVILNVVDTPGLIDCLLSLNKVLSDNLEILVVHNGPRSPEFERAVRSASAKISEVIFTGSNRGFAAGNNAGIKRAMESGAEYVLLLNDDTVIAPDSIDRLLAEAQKDPATGMLGPRILYFSDPDKIWFSGAIFIPNKCAFSFPGADQYQSSYEHFEPESTDYVTGCAVLVSRRLIEAVGLLDERFFLYWEDSDWGFRAARAGFKSVIVPSAKIWHKVSASSGGTDSALKAYYKTRSQLLFAALYSPQARRQVLFNIIRDIAWLLLRSAERERIKKSASRVLACVHYISGWTGIGPDWLTRS